MKKLITIIFSLYCICCSLFVSHSQEIKAGFSIERLGRIDTILNNYIDAHQLPGATVLIVRNNETVYNKSFGFSNLEQKIPMKNDNIFGIASMTKLITSISALILYEKGYFRINDKLSDYLPEFKNMKVFVKKNGKTVIEDAKQDILIRDLFRHTTGLKYGGKEYNDIGATFTKVKSVKELVQKISRVPLYAEPGTKFEYSYSTDILGNLVERLSGQTLQEFFKENIFEPLEMKDTDFYLVDNKVDRMVSFYEYKNNKLVLKESSRNSKYRVKDGIFSGGGGLISTAKDYAKVLQMLLNGGNHQSAQILSRKTIELMIADHLADVPNKGFLSNGRGHGLGVGVIPDAAKFGEIFSEGAVFWSGIRNTFYWVDFKENMYGIIMTQMTPYKYLPYGKMFRILTYQALVDK